MFHISPDLQFVILIFLLPVGLFLAILRNSRRRLRIKLGGSLEELTAHIVRLGQGDFSSVVPVSPDATNSVMNDLAKTQASLQMMDLKRKDAEARNARLAQLYAALSRCNNAIVRCSNEQELFSQVCRLVVDHGGMLLAWIGRLDENTLQIVPIAAYGTELGYLNGLQVSGDANQAAAFGPTGTALRDNRPIWCQDFQNDPMTSLWHVRAATYGLGSAAALPLRCDKGRHMAITIYAEASNAFDDQARALLLEMVFDINYALGVFEQRKAHRQAQEEILYLGQHDALTGLSNRSKLEEHARHVIGLAQRNPASMALIFLDLDHFKDINDTLGHGVGDLVLIEMANRLRLALRQEDTISRFGGDEFILMLNNVDAEAATLVVEKVLAVIGQPVSIEHYDLHITASIGVAMFPADGMDVDTLCKNADAAMYRVKQGGRHSYCFFTADMQEKAARKLQLVNELRHALARNQLTLHYQPQVSIQHGHIVGTEALLRWTHPDLGVVSPGEFIPAAEESGLISPIGEWVLRQAVRDLSNWLVNGLPKMVVAVNLSAVQFRDPYLPTLISKILAEEGLPPACLEVELTEGVAMSDSPHVIAMMNAVHERGVRMSIDDFGTGYSSLSYLKKFKVYKLKIDQSFVRDICTDPGDRAIVAAIIHMAKSLGLHTIAEGVETAEQEAFLRAQGCDEGQGYHFSKPLPTTEFKAYAASHSHAKGSERMDSVETIEL